MLVVPVAAGAIDLVPNNTDLPDTGVATPVPIPESPLKIVTPPDDVLNGVPTPTPTPEGASPGPEPESQPEEPAPDEGSPPGEVQDPPASGNEEQPARNDTPEAGIPVGPAIERHERDIADAGIRMGLLRPQVEGIRGVTPGLAVLATRAKELATPLAAPMGLGVVAMLLLGLATRGPGVISKLNEELESADGRQVWRL